MTKYAIFKNKQIAYSMTGQGFPLVFIHGFCEDRSMWETFVTPFEANYRVITIDIGGFGASELPVNLTISVMAEQINAVLEMENIHQCIMIGHSMGGYAALAFAEMYGDKLAGLTMFHSHPFADTEAKKANRDKGLAFLEKHGVYKFVTPLLPQLFSPMARMEYKNIVQSLIKKAQKYDLNAVYDALDAMKNRPSRAHLLEKVGCPVQFIIGKLDGSVSLEQSLQQSNLPKVADIQIFEKIGHMGMFTATKETQKVLSDFVLFCLR